MKVVGDRLSEWASSERDVTNVDLFGRSAFNRYYYSAFLVTRQLLRELDPSWGKLAHSAIPGVLGGALAKRVRKQIKTLRKQNLISDSEESRYRSSLNTATSQLADLLNASYSVRVTADYEPEIRVDTSGSHLKLDDVTIDTANNWPDRASLYCGTIRRIWREVGLG